MGRIMEGSGSSRSAWTITLCQTQKFQCRGVSCRRSAAFNGQELVCAPPLNTRCGDRPRNQLLEQRHSEETASPLKNLVSATAAVDRLDESELWVCTAKK